MEVLAIIPARGNSKSIPLKNIQKLNGIPLIGYTIKAALNCKKISRVIVSTDNEQIKKISEKFGAETPFVRPRRLSSDKASTFSVIEHTLNFLKLRENYVPEIITVLQPTSPFRSSTKIDHSINLLKRSKATSVVGVSKTKNHPYRVFWPDKEFLKPTRNDFLKFHQRQMFPVCYYPTGEIYTFWYKTFEKYGNTYGPKIKPLVSSSDEIRIDIDSLFDLFMSEMVIKNWDKYKLLKR